MTTLPASAGRDVSFAGVLNSEWIKLRSLRSPFWSYSTVFLIVVAFALLMSMAFSLAVSEGAGAEVASELGLPSLEAGALGGLVSTMATQLAQLIVAALAVLMISGEYSTGMMRSTLVAVPARVPVLLAKGAVLAAATFAVGAAASFAAFFATAPVLAGAGLDSSITDPEVLRMLFGSALYLVGVALLSLALGAMLRSAAGGIAASVGVLMLLPAILSMIPVEAIQGVLPFLPSAAGQRIFDATQAGILSPWQGLGVMALWVIAALIGATILLKKRDA